MDRHTPNLDRTTFDPRDAIQGEDGEWYHLPTLKALHRLGRLSTDSPAYMILLHVLQLEAPRHVRLTA
ncbi:hypothetical protein D3875_13655 [Deinococcus cavernae]|uniref:Uncharacterized protein n=1 Tax=Deinococcus cavernae TaxID=2320857 RepID=A0A418V8M6_9DEIO|nr:hypothetical protein [Deinococcus cavernae]RJF72440.1 hypothetical protein D3875_13655 [Deinococcus cavernae]